MATNAVDRNTNSSAVFKLTFAAGTELHGATSNFLTSNVTGFPTANNHTLAEIMTSYWSVLQLHISVWMMVTMHLLTSTLIITYRISFAVTHDPNEMRTADAPYWPSYISNGNGTVANGESVGFDTLAITYTTIETQPDADASAKCDFFANKGTFSMV